jgi:hypothetical protein
LWIPQGANPLAATDADAAAINATAPAPPGAPAAQPGTPPGAAGAPPDPGAGGGSAGPAAVGSAHRALAALPAATSATAAVAGMAGKSTRPAGRARARRRPPGLRLEPADDPTSGRSTGHAAAYTVPPALRARHEQAIGDALDGMVERLVERTVARLQGPKQRKGTRHYQMNDNSSDDSSGSGTAGGPMQVKALDTARVVDADRWGQELVGAAGPAVTAAGDDAAQSAGDALAEASGGDRAALLRDAAVAAVAAGALGMLRRSAQLQGERLAAALNLADQAGADLASIVARVRAWGGRLRRWARALATQLTTAMLEGCGQAVALAAIRAGLIDPARLTQTWLTRHDEKVRATHRAADGQTVALTAPFVVGGALLRHPGDPLGPAAETANCRCGTQIRVRPATPHPVVTGDTVLA